MAFQHFPNMKCISDKFVEATKEWLGKDGIDFFRKNFEEYNTVSPVIMEEHDLAPHPVHFREGMKVRNFMRSSGFCQNFYGVEWDDHDYDNNWEHLIELVIKSTSEIKQEVTKDPFR